jgi:hypothetical protein
MERQMTIRAKFSLANDTFARSLLTAAAALLLLAGFAIGSLAHADDIAAGNAVLLDPFDPVQQIHFSDCDRDCGYHHCDDGCGYRRHCWHDCRDHDAWRDGWRCDHDCRYFDRDHWRCERDCGRDPEDLGPGWYERMREYGHQMENWHGDMREWHDAMGEWREENGHWFFRHEEHADYEWHQDGDHWRYWHADGWHDDGEDGHWHGGHHDDHESDHHDDHGDDHHDGDHH